MGGFSVSRARRAAGRGALSLAVMTLVVLGSATPAAAAAAASIDPTTVSPGDEVTISGTGWLPSSPVGSAFTSNGTDFEQLSSLETPAPDGSFSVARTLPSDLAPGEYVMQVSGLPCCEIQAGVPVPVFVEVPFTIVAAEPPPAEEQPPVVSPSSPTPAPPGEPVETQVGGATESSTAAGGSASELPRTGSWSALLVGIGALLVLTGGFLVGFARQGHRRGTQRRKLALVRGVALVMSAVLLVAACGDDGDDSSDDQTEEPADDGDDGGEDVDVEDLDYAGALFAIEDFEGFVPGDYVVDREGAFADAQLQELCQEDRVGPSAVAGNELYFEDSPTTMQFGSAVWAFGTEDEAEDAFEQSRKIAESCESFMSNSGSQRYTREPSPGIPESGDESFDLLARGDDTGTLVGDHYVRDGQFVFNAYFIQTQDWPASDDVLATMAEAASEKFLDWVEATTG